MDVKLDLQLLVQLHEVDLGISHLTCCLSGLLKRLTAAYFKYIQGILGYEFDVVVIFVGRLCVEVIEVDHHVDRYRANEKEGSQEYELYDGFKSSQLLIEFVHCFVRVRQCLNQRERVHDICNRYVSHVHERES